MTSHNFSLIKSLKHKINIPKIVDSNDGCYKYDSFPVKCVDKGHHLGNYKDTSNFLRELLKNVLRLHLSPIEVS